MKRHSRLYRLPKNESRVIVQNKRTICISVPSADNKELFTQHEFNPPSNNRKRG